ncbi:hypothetical protein [Crossiella cryophila]|uniref:Uncharacterized protein n=1 Tax=Crossiella cryophila TaxID=43355 RepID=A0A7W7CIE8_9PSEU|nr:hypothetical protein [Crossiella cryophila]MBB4681805.1 hypothetical protein [Crossiella cryophila]
MSGHFADLPEKDRVLLNVVSGYAMVALRGSPEEAKLADARHRLAGLFMPLEDLLMMTADGVPSVELAERIGYCLTRLPQALNDHGDALEAYGAKVQAEAIELNAMFPDDPPPAVRSLVPGAESLGGNDSASADREAK